MKKIILLSLILSACSPQADKECGFTKNIYGQNISWKQNLPVVLKLHESVSPDFERDILEAAKVWNSATNRELIQIDTARLYGPALPHKDGINVIYSLNTWELNKSTEQARTSLYWNSDEIKEADIRINLKNFTFYTQDDNSFHLGINLRALMIHEMGHVLGLAHNESVSSSMYPYLENSLDRINLTEQDTKNINCEY